MSRKIAIVLGTRPEAIKLAPVIARLRRNPERWQTSLVVTAQHREMLDQVLQLFDLKPDYDLNLMRPGQNLFDVTSSALTGLREVFEVTEPDMVLVQGDTTTVFAGALAAYYLKIPVGHVEAGLRTGQRYSPFPEELNRRLTGSLTDLHFAPTSTAAWNLKQEGVETEKILVTGNTVIDALLETAAREDLPDFPDLSSPLILLTAHRRESFGTPLGRIFSAVAELASRHPECQVVYPVHPNPSVRKAASDKLEGIGNVQLCDPLDYASFVSLMKRARLILTDSGGIQEEAPSLGVPVLVLRDVTERPEAIKAGTVKLVGSDPERILEESGKILSDDSHHRLMSEAQNPYGDGRAAARIEAMLAHHFYREARPDAFSPEQGDSW
ncbi:MAG: UDP-N-acetylglucosamine 2-epimerase (non-hydrolyzing) [Candidatus Krumholzibacteria bacterium]|jgi:UDP-N-acetylglucosamine 2-epimerase (non-hydrolysing)|nr:UDP-N-acetylglucosamine 2-epimerase (non-hydrolyzing) [Candidatus Krumholzibacteria bacterium]MDP6669370.1 UDP-N-acetylglucosamine 2-epimerase (non-hydrolyzing) [Candidatus Krumholzibacteria bacterium]MDP6796741.1 UDP-N-acetylglucosamine 2-epimerase (non-hydrolyzing) [Candidatus Krumholzibacteria bacterium]MDP7022358.1 UDP-N-acetylglucosamine 2-epimerase (non-hydrolyzing) [Candidatus Krumholzibacteria bacterium]